MKALATPHVINRLVIFSVRPNRFFAGPKANTPLAAKDITGRYKTLHTAAGGWATTYWFLLKSKIIH